MTAGFQCFTDPNGDIYVADGVVMQLRSGVRIMTGSGVKFSPLLPSRQGDRFVSVAGGSGAAFVGGSGRNVAMSGLPAGMSGPVPPAGIFQPREPGVYLLGSFILTVTGASAATLADATNTVAVWSAGGAAPTGSYASTSYGQTTYNGGGAFTITVAEEIPGGGAIPDRRLSVTSGSAATGNLTAVDAANYILATDSAWTIAVATDGSAELRHAAAVVATRANGSPCDPDGQYEATAAGMAAHNLTALEPVSGEPWAATVAVSPRLPRAGFVYVKITETAGVLTSAAGPFFDTALPADSATVFHVPVAQCDGSAFEQFHSGMLIWPDTGTPGNDGVGKTWVNIWLSLWLALTPEERADPAIVYNVDPLL